MNHLEQIEGVKRDVALGQFTTFKMGGPADYYCEVTDVMKIPELIRACRKDNIPYLFLAWGSNLVFSEKGYRGLIIRNLAKQIELGENVEADGERPAGQLIYMDSGTLLSQIIPFALEHGLVGMEKMMGIPGTIGGAVRGNAGAFGKETKHIFEKGVIFDPEKDEVKDVDWNYLEFSYRHSRIKRTSEVLLKAAIRLTPGDVDASTKEIREIISYRLGRHPHGYSAGSFFKNPSRNSVGEGRSAGQLIDEIGFKGKKIGGAYISDQHCNFLMNDGSATMIDVLELSTEIQNRVFDQFGIKMQREVALVGEHGFLDDSFAA